MVNVALYLTGRFTIPFWDGGEMSFMQESHILKDITKLYLAHDYVGTTNSFLEYF